MSQHRRPARRRRCAALHLMVCLVSAFVDGQPDRYITPQVPIIGLGVIILDGLLRREWVKEDELASDLKIHPRIMRKSLRWFEQVGKRPNTNPQ